MNNQILCSYHIMHIPSNHYCSIRELVINWRSVTCVADIALQRWKSVVAFSSFEERQERISCEGWTRRSAMCQTKLLRTMRRTPVRRYARKSLCRARYVTCVYCVKEVFEWQNFWTTYSPMDLAVVDDAEWMHHYGIETVALPGGQKVWWM